MKGVLVLLACVAIALAQEEKEHSRVFTRLIPADVLRDFPGVCFASTNCSTHAPGESWNLTPFCGKSTCIEQDGRLFEMVEDCGPPPKPNPKCKLSDETDTSAGFPVCCPKFECEDGAKLEYPEIPEVPASAAAKEVTAA